MGSSINFLDTTYKEMIAAGALARIRDPELKQRIAYTFSALGNMNSRVQRK